MTNTELIREEIERRLALYKGLSEYTVNPNRIDELEQLLDFINSLPKASGDSINSNDLEEAAEEYAKDETMAGLAERAFKDGAKWQREQLRDLCYQCEKNGETIYYNGMKHAVEQMKKEALELTVYLDDDGYPCIPEIVLFDFDKNQPTAKEGDKIKVYIFRDNKE